MANPQHDPRLRRLLTWSNPFSKILPCVMVRFTVSYLFVRAFLGADLCHYESSNERVRNWNASLAQRG